MRGRGEGRIQSRLRKEKEIPNQEEKRPEKRRKREEETRRRKEGDRGRLRELVSLLTPPPP